MELADQAFAIFEYFIRALDYIVWWETTLGLTQAHGSPCKNGAHT